MGKVYYYVLLMNKFLHHYERIFFMPDNIPYPFLIIIYLFCFFIRITISFSPVAVNLFMFTFKVSSLWAAYSCAFFFFFVFWSFRGAPVAYGGSQARGLIRAIAAILRHSHSHARSLTHWARPGMEPTRSWFLAGFASVAPELHAFLFYSIW